ncbi:MAG: hypothetical protein NZ903_00255 [Candidatus Micrarchaeota archaeon]|nr:hypothetical protein [Candidatus Micrarchaeota archaeon]
MRKECPNKNENENDCPCPEISCPRHGICCECIRYHRSSKQWPKPACFR